MGLEIKIKYVYLIIANKLVLDVHATVFKLRDNYIYICIDAPNTVKDSEKWSVKIIDAGKILHELEVQNSDKLELVYDEGNKIISEIIIEELEKSRREMFYEKVRSIKYM